MLILVRLAVVALLTGAQASLVLTTEQQREFLLNAKVIGSRPAGKGITGTQRMTLSDGQLTHDASFQSIDEKSSPSDIAAGRRKAGELLFVDSYRYNIGAYEIARVVGLAHMMPVTVERRINGKTGSLSWWVDDVLMDEQARDEKKVLPPNIPAWSLRRQTMFVFGELVGDVDRNKTNVLYTKNWDVVMIDFSRGFRLHSGVRRPELLTQIEKQLFTRLETLTKDELKAAAGKSLNSSEIDAVADRSKKIVEHYRKLIRERGEEKVLY